MTDNTVNTRERVTVSVRDETSLPVKPDQLRGIREHMFKPGQSGNPKGSTNVGDTLQGKVNRLASRNEPKIDLELMLTEPGIGIMDYMATQSLLTGCDSGYLGMHSRSSLQEHSTGRPVSRAILNVVAISQADTMAELMALCSQADTVDRTENPEGGSGEGTPVGVPQSPIRLDGVDTDPQPSITPKPEEND